MNSSVHWDGLPGVRFMDSFLNGYFYGFFKDGEQCTPEVRSFRFSAVLHVCRFNLWNKKIIIILALQVFNGLLSLFKRKVKAMSVTQFL